MSDKIFTGLLLSSMGLFITILTFHKEGDQKKVKRSERSKRIRKTSIDSDYGTDENSDSTIDIASDSESEVEL